MLERRRLRVAAVSAGLVLGAATAGMAAPPPPEQKVTVGGWLLDDNGRVQLAGQLWCPGEDVGLNPQPDPPGRDNDQLTIHLPDGVFHLTEIVTAECGGAGDRAGGFYEGEGVGTFNGDPDTAVQIRLVDGGDSGEDAASYTVGTCFEVGEQGGTCLPGASTGGGPMEAGSIRMGKTFNHNQASL